MILYIEDNYENKLLVRRILEAAGHKIIEADDGLQGIQMATKMEPDLIIMDLNLPNMDGLEAATRIKAQESTRNIPIIALTAHILSGNREKSLVAGCDGYLTKPLDPNKFVSQIEKYLTGQRESIQGQDERHYLIQYSQKLVERLESKIIELEEANRQLELNSRYMEETYIDIIAALTSAMEQKHVDTAGHSQRVTRYAVAIGEEMELSPKDVLVLRRAALLHDIGKLVIEVAFIDKPGTLCETEWECIVRHPEVGAAILSPLKFLEKEVEIIRAHHERPDGKGYPHQIKNEEIPLLSGIISVADTYDAMTSWRAYKQPSSPNDAIEEIRRGSGTQFVPAIVDAALTALPKLVRSLNSPKNA